VVIELSSIRVPDGKKDEFTRALASLIGPIQVQQGCLSCRVFRSWPDEDTLHVEARWTGQNDLIAHLQSEVYKRLLLLVELGGGPPILEFFTVVECRGLDLVETARRSES